MADPASFGPEVARALADALALRDPAMPTAPSAPGVPPWLGPKEIPTAGDGLHLADAIRRAAAGDQAGIETLGRSFSRRDPVAGLDPLPQGRDAVTYSTAAVSTKHEAGQHWPELVAFRASEDFPKDDASAGPQRDGTPRPPGAAPASLEYLPRWAAGRVADLPAALSWPGAPPIARGALTAHPKAPGGLFETGRAAPRDAGRATPHAALSRVRDDFPALQQTVNGHPLVWLDNGATTHKPRAVIDAVSRFYEHDNSNVHRGSHTLAGRATDAYEGARAKVQRFLGASSPTECVFVRGATEAINLVAQSWGRENIGPGDEILVTHLEHHANIVPWQRLAEERGAWLRPVPVDDRGDVRLDAYEAMLSPRVKVVALTQVSNALGTVVPVAPMAAMARGHGARVLVDGAQSVAHLPVDVKCLGADFFVFSGHKVYGPTGIGVLWARAELLEVMPPWQSGGSMIRDVTFERTIYASPPARYEAGTPHLAGAVGLGAALDYLESLGRPQVAAWEHTLLDQMVAGLRTVPGLRIVGEPAQRAGAVSFVVDGKAPADVARDLDRQGIAVRAGHHCAQPILRRFGYEQTVRPSVGVYNRPEDIERLIAALRAPR